MPLLLLLIAWPLVLALVLALCAAAKLGDGTDGRPVEQPTARAGRRQPAASRNVSVSGSARASALSISASSS
jgi:hypothetical protein